MAREYVVDNLIIYHADLDSISRVDDVNNVMSIAIPASMCFRLLLEEHGNVVSQATLMEKVWNERGMNVSTNTLYQNISLLRKALQKQGITKDIIKTVSKRGLMIPADVAVRMNDTVVIYPIEPEGSLLVSGQPLPVKWRGKAVPVYQTCLFLFMFLCAALVSWRYAAMSIPSFSFAKYQEIKSFGECRVFRNPSLQKDSDYTEMLMRNGLTCGNEKLWYITNNAPSVRFSVFMCRDTLSDKSKNVAYCKSHYFLGMKYNEKP